MTLPTIINDNLDRQTGAVTSTCRLIQTSSIDWNLKMDSEHIQLLKELKLDQPCNLETFAGIGKRMKMKVKELRLAGYISMSGRYTDTRYELTPKGEEFVKNL